MSCCLLVAAGVLVTGEVSGSDSLGTLAEFQNLKWHEKYSFACYENALREATVAFPYSSPIYAEGSQKAHLDLEVFGRPLRSWNKDVIARLSPYWKKNAQVTEGDVALAIESLEKTIAIVASGADVAQPKARSSAQAVIDAVRKRWQDNQSRVGLQVKILQDDILLLKSFRPESFGTFDGAALPGTRADVEALFPELAGSVYEVRMPSSPDSNCLGHSLGIPKNVNLLPSIAGQTDGWSVLGDSMFGDVYSELDSVMSHFGYGPRQPFVGEGLLADGAIVVYEGDITSMVDLVNLFSSGGTVAGPVHAAVVNANGAFESQLGLGNNVVVHQDADALSGDLYGQPRFVYTPSKR